MVEEMTEIIIAIVIALTQCEASLPHEIGACGGVGELQITEIFFREYQRLGGQLDRDARYSPMLSRQIVHHVLAERFRRRGITEQTNPDEILRYTAWLWSSGNAELYSRLKQIMGAQ